MAKNVKKRIKKPWNNSPWCNKPFLLITYNKRDRTIEYFI